MSERSSARLRTTAALTAGAGIAMAVALVLARSTGLWLDEAQTVAIARLPLADLVDALRRDGAPPLYYVLLHGWMRVFGEGDTAVRALSAVTAVATVPFTVAAARHTLGRRTALLTGGLMMTVPFFYRYATETRMYALVALLVAAGWWLAATRRLVALGVVTGLLLLTHYWAFFLVLVGIGMLAWMRRWSTAVAVAAGGLLFVPWIPTFLYQVAHTGAPWGRPARLDSFDVALAGFGGGAGRVNTLAVLYVASAVLAIRHTEVGRRLAVAAITPLWIGFVVSAATAAAFAERYAAIALVPFVLLVAAGLHHIGGRRATRVFLAALLVFGVVNTVRTVHGQRSQAPSIASAIREQSAPGDLVVFCPDQLGPAVSRLLPDNTATSAYPLGDKGDIVNWVDYADRNRHADPVAFARRVEAETSGAVWVVHAPGYRTLGRQCTALVEELRRLRPGDERVVRSKRSSYERASLWKFQERD